MSCSYRLVWNVALCIRIRKWHCIKTHEVRTLFGSSRPIFELAVNDLGFYKAIAFSCWHLTQRVHTSCIFVRRGLSSFGIRRFRRGQFARVTAFQQPEITCV